MLNKKFIIQFDMISAAILLKIAKLKVTYSQFSNQQLYIISFKLKIKLISIN